MLNVTSYICSSLLFFSLLGCLENEGIKLIENLPKKQNDERFILLEENLNLAEVAATNKDKPVDRTNELKKSNISPWKYKDMNFVGEGKLSCDILGCQIILRDANAKESISLVSFQQEFTKEYSLENFRRYFNNISLSVDAPMEPFRQSNFIESVAVISRWENGILSGSFDVDLSNACYIPAPPCCWGSCPQQIIPDCVEELGQESFRVEFSIILPNPEL